MRQRRYFYVTRVDYSPALQNVHAAAAALYHGAAIVTLVGQRSSYACDHHMEIFSGSAAFHFGRFPVPSRVFWSDLLRFYSLHVVTMGDSLEGCDFRVWMSQPGDGVCAITLAGHPARMGRLLRAIVMAC